jgi:predicted negative regulator of RcsB-dependent stress response
MKRKYLTVFALGFLAMIGWNVFLIQRDERMYDAYYHNQVIENLQKPPSDKIN